MRIRMVMPLRRTRRCGAALLALRRVPEAVAAFHRCYTCSYGAAPS